jgi:hypothetical protein
VATAAELVVRFRVCRRPVYAAVSFSRWSHSLERLNALSDSAIRYGYSLRTAGGTGASVASASNSSAAFS